MGREREREREGEREGGRESCNLYFRCPKLFHTFSHLLTSFFLHKCINSIIIHQHM